MAVPLIGIDLIEPARLRARVNRTPELLDELFTQAEQTYASGQSDPFLHLAARFCAKEAAAKALGLDGFDPLDIEVVGGGESVTIALRGAALSRADEVGVELRISLTHIESLAAAVALAVPLSPVVVSAVDESTGV